jgi:hypothetical protein
VRVNLPEQGVENQVAGKLSLFKLGFVTDPLGPPRQGRGPDRYRNSRPVRQSFFQVTSAGRSGGQSGGYNGSRGFRLPGSRSTTVRTFGSISCCPPAAGLGVVRRVIGSPGVPTRTSASTCATCLVGKLVRSGVGGLGGRVRPGGSSESGHGCVRDPSFPPMRVRGPDTFSGSSGQVSSP